MAFPRTEFASKFTLNRPSSLVVSLTGAATPESNDDPTGQEEMTRHYPLETAL